MNDAFGGAKLEVRAATAATYGNLPKVTVDIPPLVCPPDGLPPIGVDRGQNRWSLFITVLLLVVLFELVVRAGRHVLQLDLVLIGGWLTATALHEAGHAIAAPRRWEGAERFRRDFFWFVAGGPATSLAIGTIGLLASPERSVIWFCSIISLAAGRAGPSGELGRSLWRGGQPTSWLCHRATLERLAASNSSSS